MRYGFIRDHAHTFPIATLCRVLEVSRRVRSGKRSRCRVSRRQFGLLIS